MREAVMFRNSITILFLSLMPSLVFAKTLQLDDQYAVFEGEPINLKEFVGKKPVYLKFWATWCLDCRRELPNLQQTYEKYKNDIAFFAVNLNINETDEYIQKLKQKNKLTIPIVMDNNGSIASNFPFYGTPFHVLMNAQGQVVYTTYKDDADLQHQLASLIKKPDATQNAVASVAATKSVEALPKDASLIYLSATWCDWYMKDIHPEMANNCINATNMMNTFYQQNPKFLLQGYVTHLWTEEKDLKEYLSKHSINYPVKIDANNTIARQYKTTQYPTLLVFKGNKEIKRYEKFDQPDTIAKELQTLMK
jgi:thiol-disulfide isomerase/thioredoxin